METMEVARRVAAANMQGLNVLGYNNMMGPFDNVIASQEIFDQTRPRVVNPQTTGHSTRDGIFGLIGTGLQVINNAFSQQPIYYAPGGALQYQQQQQGILPAQQVSAGVGAGFNNVAGQFGVSSTTMILLIGAGIYLFTRK